MHAFKHASALWQGVRTRLKSKSGAGGLKFTYAVRFSIARCVVRGVAVARMAVMEPTREGVVVNHSLHDAS